MTETTFTLCGKPGLGIMMWLLSVCASNQAFKDVYIELSSPGVILNQKIDIPMDEKYSLVFTFRPVVQQGSAQKSKPFNTYLCDRIPTRQTDQTAENRIDQPLSLDIEFTTDDGKFVRREQLIPICSRGENLTSLRFEQIAMKRGKYNVAIINRNPILPSFDGKTKAIFHGQGAGFP